MFLVSIYLIFLELCSCQFQEVTELVNENESLRIESKERELIIKALIKNKNKRKYAAKDLGISERTLYRKIKHYNLDKDH